MHKITSEEDEETEAEHSGVGAVCVTVLIGLDVSGLFHLHCRVFSKSLVIGKAVNSMITASHRSLPGRCCTGEPVAGSDVNLGLQNL